MQQSSKRRYLALWMPFLPADRWMMQVSGVTAPADLPIAFIAKQRGAMRIMAVSPAALDLGLAPGMALADARSRIPNLTTVTHKPAEDALWLEQIADHCRHYSPSIAIDLPDAIILDITGCTHLFGDEAKLKSDIETSFAGVHVHIAAAYTPEAALALARFAAGDSQPAIETLPVAALGLDETTETALRRAGLVTIGDLANRPIAPLAARFGDQAVAALDRLLGRRDSRIVPRVPDAPLVVEMRFAEPVVQAEAALSALDALVAKAAIELTQRGRGGRNFVARFYRSDGAKTNLAIETGRPSRDPAVITRLFRERIEGLTDPLDPGFGFDMITLAVLTLEPIASAQLSLEGDLKNEEVLAALVDRLGARLGRHRIRRFAPRNSHIPERGFRTFPAIAVPKLQMEWPVIKRGDPPRRPLHLFNPPERIDVIAGVPDGPPRRFRWRREEYNVTRQEGPERIADEWWHLGKATPTRDYYRVEDAKGARFWIFRDGLYDGAEPPPAWYLHGLFA